MLAPRIQKRPPRPTARTALIPAPVGVNLVDTAGQLPPGDALAIVNMFRGEYGLRTRSGYRDWVTGINSGGEVKTVIGFAGSTSGEDRLFACAQDGIYNATTSTATPTRVYAFPTANASSGICVGRGFVTAAGGHYLLVCDEVNGYIHYNESGDTWTLVPQGAGAGEINGADPRTFAFVTAWKNRLWFVQKDTQIGWYLPVNSLTGTVARFDFGPQFKHGGHLVGLWSASLDGGEGLDDYLVAISSSGDVVVYRGTDPSSASTFALKGVWYVGSVPSGRRIATDHGGDLIILSSLGAIPLSKLMAGVSIASPDSYASRKIGPKLSRLLAERTGDGWSIAVHPEDKTLVVNTPLETPTSPREQWVMTLTAGGWSMQSGLPMNCMESWGGQLYFGTTGGKVCINDGDIDNVGIGTTADSVAIEGWLISGHSDLGFVGWKRLTSARTHFKTDGSTPQWSVFGRVDYDTSEPASVSYVTPSSNVWIWDSAVWDSSVWGTGEGTTGEWRGITGMGSSVAVALRLSTRARVTLTGIDVMFSTGGAW